MGKMKNGDITGLVGEVVLSKWKGRKVVKKKPIIKAAPSTNQIRQRNKLNVANEFLKDIKTLTAVGFQDSDKISSYNECVSEMLRNVVKLENGDLILNYSQIKISRGTMPKPVIESVEILPDSIKLTWRKDIRVSGSRKNDEAVVLVFPETGKPVIYDCIGLRSEGTGTIQIPDSLNKPYHVWIFFSNPRMFPYESKQKVSDSIYLGEF